MDLKSAPHGYYSLPGYELIAINRQGTKAGVEAVLYLSSNLNVIVMEYLNFSDDSLESLFVEIFIPKAKNIICWSYLQSTFC